MKKLLVFAALAVVGSAMGQVWNEVGDAGELVATHQVTIGVGPMTAISGSWASANDVDLYCLHLLDPQGFSATTTGGTTVDTQLWLFDSNGNGIAFDDDSPAGGLQSRLTSLFTANMAIGTELLLGISAFDRDALNAAGGEIWLDTPFNVERAPDGAGGALAGWGGAGGGSGAYRIALTGAGFNAVPEPASLAVLGLGALALIRRRKQ